MFLVIWRGDVVLGFANISWAAIVCPALLSASSISSEKSIGPKVVKPGFESQFYSLLVVCHLAFQSLNSFC